jgi:hypothetical protein
MPTSRPQRDMITGTIGRSLPTSAICCRTSYPLRLRIAAPCLDQVRDGFAAPATLAEAVENVVTLRTPEPTTPRALRGAQDDRVLGMAIAVSPCVRPDGAAG